MRPITWYCISNVTYIIFKPRPLNETVPVLHDYRLYACAGRIYAGRLYYNSNDALHKNTLAKYKIISLYKFEEENKEA